MPVNPDEFSPETRQARLGEFETIDVPGETSLDPGLVEAIAAQVILVGAVLAPGILGQVLPPFLLREG